MQVDKGEQSRESEEVDLRRQMLFAEKVWFCAKGERESVRSTKNEAWGSLNKGI